MARRFLSTVLIATACVVASGAVAAPDKAKDKPSAQQPHATKPKLNLGSWSAVTPGAKRRAKRHRGLLAPAKANTAGTKLNPQPEPPAPQ